MRYRSAAAIVLSLVTAIFVMLNWSMFAAVARIDLLATTVQAPVGLVMVVLFGAIALIVSSYLGAWQLTLLAEFRRQSKQLEAQRVLAERAEASRFTELSALLKVEMESVRNAIRDSENSVAATLAEMDDRLSGTAGS